MLLLARNLMKAGISVYDGISPALLATISLSQNIKGNNHVQLVNSLKKSNIIQSERILSSLKKLDRSIFTQESKVYENKPYKISKGQCMTDIFTHAIILSNIQPHLKVKKSIKILDIGTGHGYIAFAIWNLARQLGNIPSKVLGIDCYEECIEKCQEIKASLGVKQDELAFIKMDINQIVEQGGKYDIIVGGFFIEPSLSTKLQNMLQQDGFGIWPQVSQSGQGLFISRKGRGKQYLLQTLFSQQVVRSSVQQYFISDHNQSTEEQSSVANQLSSKQQQSIILQRMRSQRNTKKNQLQQKLKQTIKLHQSKENLKQMSLKEMQKIQEINQVLEELKRYK